MLNARAVYDSFCVVDKKVSYRLHSPTSHFPSLKIQIRLSPCLLLHIHFLYSAAVSRLLGVITIRVTLCVCEVVTENLLTLLLLTQLAIVS